MIIIKPKVNIILCLSVISAGALLFAFPQISLEGAKGGVEICLNSLIPSLFPFMALSVFIMRTNALSVPFGLLGKLTEHLFLLPEKAGQIIFMSLIGGYPLGAKITYDALENGDISETDAQRLCIFCMNCGPAFAVTALGAGIYGNVKIGAVIYISLCISSITLGVLTRFFGEKENKFRKNNEIHPISSDDITFSVWEAFNSCLKICAWVIFFAAFTACIKEKFGFTGEILSAIAEVTAGSVTVAKICPIPVVTALCGFGGFCVHCQVLKYLNACRLPYKIFFAGRLLNSAISAAVCHLILYYFPIDTDVAYTFSTARVSALSVSLPTAIAFIFMLVSMIFSIDRRKKMC